ncbi:hypothetical protein COU78_03715 [Candidatus Peregrinibacteria bacterium CG10_big_fil_rev_8_21_14_0_10_49_24]|nr:MAG: hypothetical protein COV83_05535 [Candidatus Peregrinibacteria bacterium CG11_big_fil_rev_8_21_14_0_20_49_14]PIR51226.1 MAG: hypothetical protein COU78_03715 [Candidatus Peregrinibacteria bacterium CG10_big_fil_rev_8_21_14_0_10_49_24]PJA67264.1 MAG: hypothetical protein CO157_05870 [Candidatus Peregrinibacteria bacterium CG_4_9_14_3_um_filter_49_12]
MKTSLLTTAALGSILLAGCNAQNSNKGMLSLEEQLTNPLYTERYAEELVDRMVEYKIQADPLLNDESKANTVEEARKKWLEVARDARKKQREGLRGFLITINEPIKGEVLYVDDTLYLDTTAIIAPGPNVHLYLSSIIDPRDVEFPDESAIDIGKVQSAYGAQQYAVTPVSDPEAYRTVVVWDNDLSRLLGFAQINK